MDDRTPPAQTSPTDVAIDPADLDLLKALARQREASEPDPLRFLPIAWMVLSVAFAFMLGRAAGEISTGIALAGAFVTSAVFVALDYVITKRKRARVYARALDDLRIIKLTLNRDHTAAAESDSASAPPSDPVRTYELAMKTLRVAVTPPPRLAPKPPVASEKARPSLVSG